MTVHVSIIVVQLPRSHCDAMNWLLFRLQMQLKHSPAHLFMLEKKEFTIANETDKLL